MSPETGFWEASITSTCGRTGLLVNQSGDVPHVDEDHIAMVRPA
jgi:hypothetical protein